MKIFFLCLAVLLFIAQNSIEQSSGANTLSLRKPPYYKDLLTSTPYYWDKSLEKITNPKISIRNRLYNVTDDIYFTFQLINQETCLNFEKKDNPITNSIGINFYLSSDGKNVVTLSNNPKSPTNVSLQESVYKNATSLAFYIGLALGLIPEVARPDRNIDVKVDMNNVQDDYKKYYKIALPGVVPYLKDTDFDFKSAMFFGSDFGLSNGKQSTYIVDLYKDYQYPSTVSKSFSHNDYKHMYYYYCDGSKKQNNCKYGGYPFPKDQRYCKCPYYLDGNKCENFIFRNNLIHTFAERITKKSLVASDTEECVIVNLTDELLYLNVTSKNNKKNVSIVVEELTFERNDCKIDKS
uniref:Astacin domain-containing protein n=1 Tax=Strongyloides papillosus TaxID=174720 RepID=A0A0N5BLE9_STREA